ncbi:MAG: hypothetical protein JRG79_15945 [Deltaproteobacteria bacterium]|nr:hypothetical protein [Deltaproteobacteria bacterium]
MVEVVARIERSEIRGRIETGSPDFAALYPGYTIGRLPGKMHVSSV